MKNVFEKIDFFFQKSIFSKVIFLGQMNVRHHVFQQKKFTTPKRVFWLEKVFLQKNNFFGRFFFGTENRRFFRRAPGHNVPPFWLPKGYPKPSPNRHNITRKRPGTYSARLLVHFAPWMTPGPNFYNF